MQIRFKVTGQHIEKESDPYLVAGTKNYLKMVFDFDATWNGYKKAALFNSDTAVAIVGNTCTVPEEITKLKRFSVKVVGEKDGTRIVTDFAVVDQR